MKSTADVSKAYKEALFCHENGLKLERMRFYKWLYVTNQLTDYPELQVKLPSLARQAH